MAETTFSQKQTHNPLSAFAWSPQGIHFENQDDGEEVILLLRKHWITNCGWIFLSIIFLMAPLLFSLAHSRWGFGEAFFSLTLFWKQALISLWYLLATGYAFENFLNWYFNVFIVTNERLIDVDFYGIFYKDVSEAGLSKVQDITHVTAGLFSLLFDYGQVKVQTAAEVSNIEFEKVPHPAEVHKTISRLVEEQNTAIDVVKTKINE